MLEPALPGCISEGDTREEALKNIREAIELYLEPVERRHRAIVGSGTFGITSLITGSRL